MKNEIYIKNLEKQNEELINKCKFLEEKIDSLTKNFSDDKFNLKKYIKDGKVAVIYSTKYGAGWYTCIGKPQVLFHPLLVELVLNEQQQKITQDLLKDLIGDDYYYCGAAESGDLGVCWIPIGTAFYIDEYDGKESVVKSEDISYFVA